MDAEERDRLKERAEARRLKQREAIEQEYLATINAIERVFELSVEVDMEAHPPPSILLSVTKDIHRTVNGETGPTSLVRAAIASFSNDFTYHHIRHWIAHNAPAADVPGASVSSALNKLTAQGEIRQVRAPAGRSPAVYVKVPREIQEKRITEDLLRENGLSGLEGKG